MANSVRIAVWLMTTVALSGCIRSESPDRTGPEQPFVDRGLTMIVQERWDLLLTAWAGSGAQIPLLWWERPVEGSDHLVVRSHWTCAIPNCELRLGVTAPDGEKSAVEGASPLNLTIIPSDGTWRFWIQPIYGSPNDPVIHAKVSGTLEAWVRPSASASNH